jgi:hypothetical protein
LPCACISGISSRATNGKGDEQRGQDDARHREDHLDVVLDSHGPKVPLRAEQQHEDEAGDHRARPRNGRSISVISRLLPLKVELGDRPRRRDAEATLKGSTASAMNGQPMAERVSGSFSAST